MSSHTLSPDRRAVTPVVTHVLTITITSLLVIGLLAASASYLNNQEESNAGQELDVIGNRLADEVSRVDSLAQNGGQSSIVTRHPDQITGGGYSVDQRDPTACGNVGDFCLVLASHNLDASASVPVSNSTEVTVRYDGSGVYNITGHESGSSPSVDDRENAGLDVRVGIGADIQEDPLGTRLTSLAEPPEPRFDVEPEPPTTGFTHFLNGTRSFARSGNVTQHKWDVGNDGNFTAVGEIAPHLFDEPGRQEIALQVDDDEPETEPQILTKNVTVSGLEYNQDLEEGVSDDSIRFSLHNSWESEIRLDSVFLDDLDDHIDELGNCEDDVSSGDFDSEVNIDENSNGDRDIYVQYDDESGGIFGSSCDDGLEINDDGLIVDVDQMIDNADTSAPDDVPIVGPDDDVTIEFSGLDASNLDGTEWRLGIAYLHEGEGAQTVFEDTVGAPHITDFEVVNPSGSDVVVRVEADDDLDYLDVDWTGPDSGDSLSIGDFTEDPTDPVYEATISSGTSGLFEAELDDAGVGGGANTASAFDTSHRDTVIVADGDDPAWDGGGDWNLIDPQSGVVHDDVGDHSDEVVSLGYPPHDQGASNLTAYWPMDEADGDVMADASGNDNDGETTDVFDETVGLFGTSSYSFHSDSSRVDDVDSTDALSGGDDATITVSTWIHPRESLANSDGSAVVGKLNDTTDGGDWGLVVYASCPSYARGDCNGPAIGYYGGNQTDEYALLYGPVTRTDTWHHVAFVLDGENDELDLYFDGELVARDDDAPASVSVDAGQEVVIGEHPETGENFDGYVDETRVYDRTLSGGEIQGLYDTSTRGEFVTDWSNTSSDLDVDILNLSAAVDMTYGAATVTVVTGEGERSVPIQLEDGDGTYDVEWPAPTPADTDSYRLEVALESTSRNYSPVIDALVIHEDPP